MARKKVEVIDTTLAHINPAKEDGILNALVRFSSMFFNSVISKLTMDSANRLRVAVEVMPATAVTQSGTWNIATVSTLSAITTQPVLQQYEMMDRSRVSFSEGIRANISFY